MQRIRHILILRRKKKFSGPKSSEMDRKTVEACSLVKFHISYFSLFFGKNRRRILRAKDKKRPSILLPTKMQKPAFVTIWGCISAHGMGDLHICDGTIDAEVYLGILERRMLPSR